MQFGYRIIGGIFLKIYFKFGPVVKGGTLFKVLLCLAPGKLKQNVNASLQVQLNKLSVL